MKKEIKIKTKNEKPLSSGRNYPPDPHNVFCRRCYEFNRKCPNTGTKKKDGECRL